MKQARSKGQYFSFDAIIATVIVVISMTTLVAYWFSIQSVVDTRSNTLQSAASAMADTLLSPGIPANWTIPVIDPNTGLKVYPVQQRGLANGFTNDINETKSAVLQQLVNNIDYYSASSAYNQTKSLFHLGGFGEEYMIVIESTNYNTGTGTGDPNNILNVTGCPYPADASEVAIVHRGGTWIHDLDQGRQPKPVRLLVAVWRQNQRNPIPCPPKAPSPSPT